VVDQIEDVIIGFKNSRRFAILLVEQGLHFAARLADAYVIMAKGAVVAAGKTSELSAEEVKRYLWCRAAGRLRLALCSRNAHARVIWSKSMSGAISRVMSRQICVGGAWQRGGSGLLGYSENLAGGAVNRCAQAVERQVVSQIAEGFLHALRRQLDAEDEIRRRMTAGIAIGPSPRPRECWQRKGNKTCHGGGGRDRTSTRAWT